MKKLLLFIIIAIFSYSNNLKAQWAQIGTGASVQSLLVSGSYPSNIIYAGLPNSTVGVRYTANYGSTWNGTGWYPSYGTAYSIIQAGSQIMAGTDYGINISSDIYVNSWTHIYAAGIPNDIEVYSFAKSGGIIYAGAQYGVYSTSDYGSSWDNILFFSPTNNVFALAVSGSKIFAGTADDGVYYSSDYGNNWNVVNNGLPSYTTVYSIAISGNKIFIGTNSGVYYSTNNGSNWACVNSGLTNTIINAVAISGTNVFAATNGDGVFVSTNNGSSWAAFNSGLSSGEAYYVLSLVVNGSWIYAGTGGDGTWKRSTSIYADIENTGTENTQIFVYPNLANDIITIENTSSKNNEAMISIYNIQGQILLQQLTQQQKTVINISDFAEGLYYVKVNTDKGIAINKFIKN